MDNMHFFNISNTHSAKHCVEPTFYDWCIDETDCFAYFRDLVPGPANYEEGEFWVPLVDLYAKEGRSDLAIVKLAYPVNLPFSNSVFIRFSGAAAPRL